MRIVAGLHRVTSDDQHAILAIGNFDGVHLGHQAILKRTKYLALQQNKKAAVMLFYPQPQVYFKQSGFIPLSPLRQKLLELKEYEIDTVILVSFNAKMANLSADQFVRTILLNKLNVSTVVVGDDFKFGVNREGDYSFLNSFEFDVVQCAAIEMKGSRVSSTSIRECLKNSDLESVEQLLGHPYRLSGRVIKGEQLGRTLGYKTANLNIHSRDLALRGIYAVRVNGVGPHSLLGVASAGERPTMNPGELRLEVHILNFDQDIYGCLLTVEFLKKIRDEIKFDSIDALKKQIALDVKSVEEML